MRKLVYVLGLGLLAAAQASASSLTFINDRDFTSAQLEAARGMQVQLDDLFGLLPPFSADTSAHSVVFALSSGQMSLKLFGQPPKDKQHRVITRGAPETLFIFWDLVAGGEATLIEIFEFIAAFVRESQPRTRSVLSADLSSKSFRLHGMLSGLRSLSRSNLFTQLKPEDRWAVGERIKQHLENAHDLILVERQAGADCAGLLKAIYN